MRGTRNPKLVLCNTGKRGSELLELSAILMPGLKVLYCIFAGSCFQYIPLELSHQLRI